VSSINSKRSLTLIAELFQSLSTNINDKANSNDQRSKDIKDVKDVNLRNCCSNFIEKNSMLED
jgi:NRPS condensation-like uncharacterized protein